MKICVVGWYFRESLLFDLSCCGYPVFMIKHREDEMPRLPSRFYPPVEIPSKLYPNVGLEFGAYRQYVENHWDGESDVLFMHDDAAVYDMKAFRDVESLGPMGVDHAYIFHDENEEYINGGAHGRAMWIRGSILKQLAEDFPADMENHGINVGKVAQKGIFAFHERIMKLSKNTGVIAIIPQFRFAHRGRLHTEMFVYRKTHQPVPGGLVNVHE